MKFIYFLIVIIILGIIISCPNYNNPLDPEAENYQGWPVIGEGEESASWSLSGIYPENNGSIADSTPDLDWLNIDNATGYLMQWALSEENLHGSTVIELSDSEFKIDQELSLDDIVFWRVKSTNNSGGASSWSEINSYTIIEPIVSFIPITGGTFIMGDTWGGGESKELPTHTVSVSDFSLGKYQVTYEEWKEVYDWAILNGYIFSNIGRAGSNGISGGGTVLEPVTMINWRDMIVWCNSASEYKGLLPVYSYNGLIIKDARDSNDTACDNAECNWSLSGYRLPTEAEWEFTARGGNSDTNAGRYSGSDIINNVAWYSSNCGDETHPVGEKQANELGFFDMTGNVNEYCWDWYGAYSDITQTNPVGPLSGTYRVSRGGPYYFTEIDNRIAYRHVVYKPLFEYDHVGFRVAHSN